MEYRMRRGRQELKQEEAEHILRTSTSGVLALLDDSGVPYAVPMSFVAEDNCIYFHSAKTGHKIDAIRHCNKASFCVIARDDVRPEQFTTLFKSVIAFGTIDIVTGEEERMAAIYALGKKYNPNGGQALQAEIKKSSAFAIIKLEITRLTGKQSRELIEKRGDR